MITRRVANSSSSWCETVFQARAKRAMPDNPGGQSRRSGPVMMPARKASSIQPQISKTDRKEM